MSKIYAIFLIGLMLASCNNDSAIDTDEYLAKISDFDVSKVHRVTIYKVTENKWWSETAMKNRGFPFVELLNDDAATFYNGVTRKVDSNLLPSSAPESKPVLYVIVGEDLKGQKTIMKVMFRKTYEGFLYLHIKNYDDYWLCKLKLNYLKFFEN